MTAPPYIRRQDGIGGAGRRGEAGFARRTGGRARPASGATAGAKGDVVVGDALVEVKTTTAGSLRVRHDWFAKIAHEARCAGRLPALALVFVGADGRPLKDGAWVAVPEHWWRDLVESGP
jgi:hypothetical protein